MGMVGILGLLIIAILANYFHGFYGTRADAWLVALALFAAMLVTAGYSVKKRWDGIFIDGDNRISLSRVQLIFWTVVLLSALFTAGLTNAAPPDAVANPLNIRIPPQIWALLGLGSFTAVVAPAIKDGKREPAATPALTPLVDPVAARRETVAVRLQAEEKLGTTPEFDGRVLSKMNAGDARWIDIILGDYEGAAHVDVSKVQKLALTILVGVVYAAGIWTAMAASTPVVRELPAVDSGFLALLGISHAAYLVDKQIAST